MIIMAAVLTITAVTLPAPAAMPMAVEGAVSEVWPVVALNCRRLLSGSLATSVEIKPINASVSHDMSHDGTLSVC